MALLTLESFNRPVCSTGCNLTMQIIISNPKAKKKKSLFTGIQLGLIFLLIERVSYLIEVNVIFVVHIVMVSTGETQRNYTGKRCTYQR